MFSLECSSLNSEVTTTHGASDGHGRGCCASVPAGRRRSHRGDSPGASPSPSPTGRATGSVTECQCAPALAGRPGLTMLSSTVTHMGGRVVALAARAGVPLAVALGPQLEHSIVLGARSSLEVRARCSRRRRPGARQPEIHPGWQTRLQSSKARRRLQCAQPP